ncbi:MAG: hypothetical protein M0031_09840 [Thermaerobacter sp.]|nr:hypothetical protein [Thermaerobacter sp.]
MRDLEAAKRFLAAAKAAAATDRVDFVPTEKNRQALQRLGWLPGRVWELVPGLKAADLYQGPELDRRGDPEPFFMFRVGTGAEGEYYLKLKLRTSSPECLVCVSFHPPEHRW